MTSRSMNNSEEPAPVMVTNCHSFELAERLVYSQRFKPTYSGALANHLPMVLVAMDRLGASIDQIDQFIALYNHKLEVVDPVAFNITPENWTEHLGRREAFSGYQKYFKALVDRDGWEQVLTDHIGLLMGGICASAFHCLIRLGFGIKVGSPAEVAIALAYFSAEYQSLGDGVQHSGNRLDLADVIGQLTKDSELCRGAYQARNIIDRLNLVADQDSFQNIVAQLGQCTIRLSELADFALRLFASTRDFSALHGVTSCHALRWIMPYVRDQERCLTLYARALLAVYVSLAMPVVARWDEFDLKEFGSRPWGPLFNQAIDSYNDHKIKMVFSCFDEFQYYRHEGYPYCAALAIESDI